MRSAIILLLIGEIITTLGAAAVTLYAFRRRDREKFLLWFGLFSILYATVLIVRNSAFRLGFGQPQAIGLAIDHLISLSTVVPGLLLFEDFYGRGWRDSLRWLIGIYCALAVFAAMGITHPHHSRLILPPGTVLVILVPIVLAVGYLAGYKPPPLPHGRLLFTGMILFFCAFSTDRLLHRQVGNWHTGIEPYGFFALVICLWYVTVQRIIADDRRLISLNDEMRAATRIQKTILPREIPPLENADIAVRYAPMTDVAGDLYDFVTSAPCCMGVLVADVMGHGVPAALVASMVKVAVSTRCRNDGGPASIISELNTVLCKEAREQYVTATYLYLDTANGIGRHAAGAHPAPLLWRHKAQTLEKLGESGLLLGVRADEAYDESEFRFEAGDRLLLYTDGLIEAQNGSGESFGEAALSAFVRDKRSCGTEQFADLLLREVLAWSRVGWGKGQEDDITIVVIDMKGETDDNDFANVRQSLYEETPTKSAHRNGHPEFAERDSTRHGRAVQYLNFPMIVSPN